MLDNHFVPDGYGMISYFTFGSYKISTYSFFVLLGLIVGLVWFSYSFTSKNKSKVENTYFIILAALIGGFIGSKIPVFFENISILMEKPEYFKNFIFTGKSIVGGIIGGYLGVRIIKKIRKIPNVRCGNDIAPAICLGMAIGRIGCFLSGCCYGIETNLPIGVNFGDGIYRIPTQLIEMCFCFILFSFLLYKQKKCKDLIPGILFKELVIYYFIFRFFIEFIRDTNKNFLFFSVYQVICIIGIIFMIMQIRTNKKLER